MDKTLIMVITAYGNLGSIFAQQGQHNVAEKAYELALHFRSNMADIHYNL